MFLNTKLLHTNDNRKGKIVPVLNQVPHHIGACGSGNTAPRILIFGTTSRAAVSLRLLLPRKHPLISIITGSDSDQEPVFTCAPAENRTPIPRFRLNFIFETLLKSVDNVSFSIKL